MTHIPRITVSETAVRNNPLWWHIAGLSYTASGYGNKIPSAKMVRVGGRWRRVYVTQWSNAGTPWILLNGVRTVVDIQ